MKNKMNEYLNRLKEIHPFYQFCVIGVPVFQNFGRKSILCVEKNRPEHLKGKFLGPGGKIEKNESPNEAMIRELKEETNLSIYEKDLEYIGHICYEDHRVLIFLYVIHLPQDEIENLEQLTDEKLHIFTDHYKYFEDTFSETTKIILKRIFR